MPASVIVNGQTVVHKDSGGQVVTTDVCLTPCGSAMVPVPYTNIAKSADTTDGSKKLAIDGNEIMLKDSKFSTSSGDNPGKAGVASGTVKGWAKFVSFSSDTFCEGQPVCRRTDIMISNNGNTPPAPLMQPNNSADEVKVQGTHSLITSLSFRYAKTVDGSKLLQLSSSYTVSGPQTFKYEKKKDGDISAPISFTDCAEGEYDLTIELDRKEKKTPYEDAEK